MSKGPVEEFTVAGGGDSPDGSPSDGPQRPRNQRPWRGPLPWAGCAVVILLLGFALVAPLPTPVGPWGQVTDVTSTPQQAWTLEADEDIYSVRMAGDVLVTTGAQTVRGIDPASGEALWQVALIDGRCTTDTTNLACSDAAGRAVQIDPATGTVTELDITDTIAVATSEGDLFAVTDDEDLAVHAGDEGQVQRISDGEVVWSTPVSVGQEYRSFRDPLAVIAGHVLTTAVMDQDQFGAVGAVFDARTGERLPSTQPYVVQLGPGVWVAQDFEASALYVRGEDEPRTTKKRHVLQYDDDWRNTDVVTMSQEGRLTVHDEDSDELQWRYERMAYPVARVDGVLFVLTPDGDSSTMQGLRASSGELLWERADSWMMCPCVSDRSTLAGQLQTLAQDGLFTADGPVVGIDAESGTELWRLEAPVGMFQIVSDGKYLVLASPGQMTGWRLG